MYYIEQDNKVVLFSEFLSELEQTIAFMPQYEGLPIKQLEEGYVIDNFEIITEAEYEQRQADLRQEEFLKDFFKVDLSDIFGIERYGYYRKQPKGYQSAVESMNVLFNIANVTKGIQAGLIIFYQEPDFTKSEECTEEWLVEHQIVLPALTLEQFLALYVVFMTAWNTDEHESEAI